MMKKSDFVLYRKRDFSDVINATFAFLTSEILPYLKAIVLFCGIPILLTSILAAWFSDDIMGQIFVQIFSGGENIEGMTANPGVLSLLYLTSFLAYFFLIGITYAYLSVYSINGRGGFTSKDIWNEFASQFWPLLAIFILTVFLVAGTGGIGAVVIMIITSLAGTGTLAGLLIFLGTIAFIVLPVIYVMISFSLASMVLFVEKKGIIASFGRSFKLVSGYWWLTFGIVFILLLIVTALSMLFSLPVMVAGFIKGYFAMSGEGGIDNHSVALIVTSVLSGIGQYLVYAILLIGIGVQYFSLREQKDNRDLLQKVSEMAAESN